MQVCLFFLRWSWFHKSVFKLLKIVLTISVSWDNKKLQWTKLELQRKKNPQKASKNEISSVNMGDQKRLKKKRTQSMS